MKIPRREFLQQASTYRPGMDVSGWYMSEKLDGTRCFWDGGLTRGLVTETIPWANIHHPKTGHRKDKIKPYSSGLWSQYGNPILAPEWFLDLLPPMPLDGELWIDRGQFQLCRSICSGDSPDPRFNLIKYAVYSCPPLDRVFQSGEIKNANFYRTFDYARIKRFLIDASTQFQYVCLDQKADFETELLTLNNHLSNDRIYIHPQIKLPMDKEEASQQVESELDKVINRGGEGLILRDPKSIWYPKKVRSILKYKPTDVEALYLRQDT